MAADAQLLGRVTYEGFAKAWPSMEDPFGFAEKMNGMPKYVVSTTLTDPSWNNTPVLRGPAEAAGLITVHESRVEVRHPLARSAIYGDAPADRRRELHRTLASALPDTEADRRAWHLALASFGPDDVASSALEQAGQRRGDREGAQLP